jgi:hypothetical protein
MYIRTRKYTKPVAKMGFVVGDVAYWTDAQPLKPLVQYQLRIVDLVRSTAVCRVVMTRHRETALGRDTGVWCAWTPASQLTKNIHLKELSKKAG